MYLLNTLQLLPRQVYEVIILFETLLQIRERKAREKLAQLQCEKEIEALRSVKLYIIIDPHQAYARRVNTSIILHFLVNRRRIRGSFKTVSEYTQSAGIRQTSSSSQETTLFSIASWLVAVLTPIVCRADSRSIVGDTNASATSDNWGALVFPNCDYVW